MITLTTSPIRTCNSTRDFFLLESQEFLLPYFLPKSARSWNPIVFKFRTDERRLSIFGVVPVQVGPGRWQGGLPAVLRNGPLSPRGERTSWLVKPPEIDPFVCGIRLTSPSHVVELTDDVHKSSPVYYRRANFEMTSPERVRSAPGENRSSQEPSGRGVEQKLLLIGVLFCFFNAVLKCKTNYFL